MEQWRVVERDGNPAEEGVYDVVLISPVGTFEQHGDEVCYMEEKDWRPDGTERAVIESRWFGPAHVGVDWLMKDQPKEGLAWHEESGSYYKERVYAWLPRREMPEIELPEGVTWEEGQREL